MRNCVINFLVLAAFLTLAAAGCSGERAEAPDTAERSGAAVPNTPLGHTNVVLITVDALRADHLGCYGYKRDTSPSLDALANEGTLFTHAFVPKGSTWPSLATIHTALWPVTHGVRYNGMRLKDESEQLAEVLADNGYTCGAFVTNGGRQNFEGFEVKRTYDQVQRDILAVRDALEWMEGHAQQKMFLWLHLFAPHGPYDPPKPERKFTDPNYTGDLDGSYERTSQVFAEQEELSPEDLGHVIDLYDDEVLQTDRMVDSVRRKLSGLGLAGNTLIVFTADHGEELYDHHKYFHHQASVYEGTLRVPFLVWMPGTVPAGKRIEHPVSVIHTAPTILELVGIAPPASFQGKSLVPAFGDTPADFGPVFGEWGDKMLIVRTDQYKYVWNPANYHPPVKRERENANELVTAADEHSIPMKATELYRITDDPGERRELSSEAPEVIAELQGHLDQFREQYNWILDDALVELQKKEDLDPETRQELENLGYVL
ncbi:MAG: sulfatase [Candidatus Hydrogenedentes bacterium]|nr:sulfatase [Candidatus Hydrogenedentota bacterium]